MSASALAAMSHTCIFADKLHSTTWSQSVSQGFYSRWGPAGSNVDASQKALHLHKVLRQLE